MTKSFELDREKNVSVAPTSSSCSFFNQYLLPRLRTADLIETIHPAAFNAAFYFPPSKHLTLPKTRRDLVEDRRSGLRSLMIFLLTSPDEINNMCLLSQGLWLQTNEITE